MSFSPPSLAVLTSEGIVFINDFSHSKPPGSTGKKVYIASPHASPHAHLCASHIVVARAAAPLTGPARAGLRTDRLLPGHRLLPRTAVGVLSVVAAAPDEAQAEDA